jgi:hypothetical protein
MSQSACALVAAPDQLTLVRATLSDYVYPCCGQPRLPDPSYAGPALVVAREDKSGAALTWFLLLLSS